MLKVFMQLMFSEKIPIINGTFTHPIKERPHSILRMNFRTVPWSSRTEWLSTRSDLYDADRQRRRRGVEKVKAWRSRGKVPHAADLTASFVEVQLADIEAREGRRTKRRRTSFVASEEVGGISEHQLRLMYTMVFVRWVEILDSLISSLVLMVFFVPRFVNGLADPYQRSTYARSISSIAAELGLPSWFVDLRHAGTHGALPTLNLLRNGCAQALQWLENGYWNRAGEAKPTELGETEEERKIVENWEAAMKEGKKHVVESAAKSTSNSLLALPRKRLVSCILRPGRLMFLDAQSPDLNAWKPLLSRLSEAWPSFTAALCLNALSLGHFDLAISVIENLSVHANELKDVARACLAQAEKADDKVDEGIAEVLKVVATKLGKETEWNGIVGWLEIKAKAGKRILEPEGKADKEDDDLRRMLGERVEVAMKARTAKKAAEDLNPTNPWKRVTEPYSATPLGLLPGQSLDGLAKMLELPSRARTPTIELGNDEGIEDREEVDEDFSLRQEEELQPLEVYNISLW